MFCSFELVVFAKSRRTLAPSNLAGEIVGVVESRRRNRHIRRISPEKSPKSSNLVVQFENSLNRGRKTKGLCLIS
ncbi:hypothetical protein F2Q69_00007353 [Brassica cretica]|uniref:Uncharacterized protein n=1 Tax=Brassica cretica TaxID=69181 RepID=A0A8S9PER9_BRACR|nr:hypothetical protein F2Q69_00007353 [Brassica cretica]